MFLTRVLLVSLFCSVAIAEEVASTPSVKKDNTAVSSLVEAAKNGDANAQVELGDFYAKAVDEVQGKKNAFKWYQRAAKLGNIEGQRKLAECYRDGKGVEKNLEEAFKWYTKLSEQGDEIGSVEHALALLRGRGTAANPVDGIKALKRLEQKGSAEAAFAINRVYWYGWGGVPVDQKESVRYCLRAAGRGHSSAKYICHAAFLYGVGVPRDTRKSMQFLREAAADGVVSAQSQLAYNLYFGEYVVQDYDEAVVLAKKASDKGDAQAQCVYGLCLRDGTSVEKDEEQAFEYFFMAANQENPWAQRLVGFAINNGTGVIEDSQKAFGWLKLSAENGDITSMRVIASRYADGNGTKKNLAESIRWFEMACRTGCDAAQAEFARRLTYGIGVPKNQKKALGYAMRSAKQGNELAQRLLLSSYFNGLGVPRNFEQADFWLSLASGQNKRPDDGAALDFLESKLTAQQVAVVQQQTLKFVPKKEVIKEEVNPLEKRVAEATVSSGSGFFITSNGYFVTNCHVIENAKEVSIEFNGKSFDAAVVLSDRKNDLAILKVEGKFPALHVKRSRSLRVADHVSTVGFPNVGLQGQNAKYSEGKVASLTGFQDDVGTMQISVPIQPGNSGGALVDNTGSVVGVIVARLSKVHSLVSRKFIPENVNYAIKSNALLNLVETRPDLDELLVEKSDEDLQSDAEIALHVTRATGRVVSKLESVEQTAGRSSTSKKHH